MYETAVQALAAKDEAAPEKAVELKEDILNSNIEMLKQHMQRVNKGKCKKDLSTPYMKILYCIDRMGNSCINLAEAALNQMDFNYFFADTNN